MQAALQKAKIRMELIDKQLEVDIAELEDEEYNLDTEKPDDFIVEKWLESSYKSQEKDSIEHPRAPSPVPPAPASKQTAAGPLPAASSRPTAECAAPAPPPQAREGSTDATLQMLTGTIKDLAAAVCAKENHANLLSRLSTPQNLPEFSGDPIEWLQFKQAYDESTEVCGFSAKENLWRLHDNKCEFCNSTHRHKLTDCKQFKKALRKTRWQYVKRKGICYKCLISRHTRDTCPAPACDKDNCGAAHHRLLHFDNNSRSERNNINASESQQQSVETVTHINASECQVLLKVVPVRIHGPNGIISASALLDDGSTVSLISSELAERAGLRGRRETMRVSGAWSSNELVCDATVTNVRLSEIVSGDKNEPFATLTPLGWCIHGVERVPQTRSNFGHVNLCFSAPASVPTEDELILRDLQEQDEWLNGPVFLLSGSESWPRDVVGKPDADEVNSAICMASNGNNYMSSEPRRKRELPARPNHILLYTIINPAYPITVTDDAYSRMDLTYEL
ncbi:uncharacterized protein LOC114353452 [Ostrinia furnacalis]|uniref:uncharacterized protein LOC114353452 n=1 Tax=Ostrinia furnacalis TaxID=93504 RepID=UPI0010407D66|nr:uncharacterized protein LOC114353452 [Ostrinia furnacalis]